LRRIDAAELLGTDPKTLIWWERNVRRPIISAYPAIIAFLSAEPWPSPTNLAEALLAERRRRGLSLADAAALIGVDEGTWRRWEHREWKPTRRTLLAIDHILGFKAAERYPHDVR
jgi:transcriptional regulator with XRE-family HTH domain